MFHAKLNQIINWAAANDTLELSEIMGQRHIGNSSESSRTQRFIQMLPHVLDRSTNSAGGVCSHLGTLPRDTNAAVEQGHCPLRNLLQALAARHFEGVQHVLK